MEKRLNLINRYSVMILDGAFVSELEDIHYVEKVFYYNTLGITVVVINDKIDKFSKYKNNIKFVFPLVQLNDDESLRKLLMKYYDIVDIIKEKINWDKPRLTLAIGLYGHGTLPNETNKFRIKVSDIDDSLNYLDTYCEFIEILEFLPEHCAILEIETQLSMEEIKDIVRGALIEQL